MSATDKMKTPDLSEALDRAARKAEERSIAVDVGKYQGYLDDPSLSDAQKEEILRALWIIISAFVELGFGVHPAQQACGQLEQELDLDRRLDSDVISSECTGLAEEFNTAPERS